MKQRHIAKELVESFGYSNQIDEYSMQDLGQDTGDFTRGAVRGATFGTSENLEAFLRSKFSGTPYEAELEKAIAANKSAEERSPYLYGAGELAGGIAAPVPGGAAVAGVKNLGKLGKFAAMAGINLGTMAAIDAVKDPHDAAALAKNKQLTQPKNQNSRQLSQLQKIIGAKVDGIYGPETKAKLQVWQQQNGIKADGLPGPETYTTAGLTNMKQQTVAESIASLRDMITSIEESQEINEAPNFAKLAQLASRRAATGAEKFIPGVADDAAKTLTPSIDKGFSDAVKRLGVVEKDGKLWAKDPQNVGKWTEVEKVGNDFARPNQAAGFNNPTWYASGPMAQQLERQLVKSAPETVEKATAEVLANPEVNEVTKEAIKKGGLLSWVKANPGKIGSVIGAAGLTGLAGLLGLSNSGTDTTAHPGSTGGQGGGKKRGSEELKQTQRMLNALTGSNLVIDGIMGPKTQAAYDAWKAGANAQAADIAKPLDDYHTAKVSTPPTDQQSPLGNIGKDQIDKVMPMSMAESITQLRVILDAIQNK